MWRARRFRSFVPVLFVALAGCVAPLADIDTDCDRTPAQARCAPTSLTQALLPGADAASADYNRRFLSLLARDRLGRADRANGTGVFGRDFRSVPSREFQAVYRALEAAAYGNAAAGTVRTARTGVFDARWRTSRQTLFVDPGGLPRDPAEFHFSGLQAETAEIDIKATGDVPAVVSGSCDGPLLLRRGRAERAIAAAETFRLDLRAAGPKATLVVSALSDLNRCRIVVAGAQGWSRQIAIRREEVADSALGALDSTYQRCDMPRSESLTALQRVFYADGPLSQTCAMPLGRLRLLADEREAFNAKVEALSGAPLPASFFDAGDPEAPIDFSRAPDLSLIYLSYLDYKADFSGRVVERLLRFHAARGAKVRIMVTGILERAKDRALLEKLAADHPNVQLQEFSWDAANGAPVGEQISVFHKTHHVKMLATLARDARRSRVLIGGRNIHDGFLFHKPLDLSDYPELQQYGQTDGLSLNYYSNWSDLDVEVSDPAAVKALTAHLSTLWHRDAETDLARPMSIPGRGTAAAPAGSQGRHYISVPYADGRALEQYYVDLFDAAREKIEIVNPYLNLTPKLAAAFGRALDRGVRITIIGRIEMKGDMGGKFLTELNELFVEKYADRITIFEYKTPDVVLHSKILLIDGEYVSLGSVNLNNRSFFHDSENGIALLDRALYGRVRKVLDHYRSLSRPVASDVHVPLAYRLLFASQQVREVF